MRIDPKGTDMPGVQDRVALVTGGAQGIGEAVALRLAAGGAKVGVLDMQKDAAQGVADQITAAGGQAIALAADVSQRGQVQSAVDELAGAFGGLHILVNNAGVIRDNLLFKMTDDDWTAVMEVHLRGAFLASQISQRHMVEARYGRIVSMSSVSADGNRGQANYSTAKAGLQGLTRTLAIELGPFGITANAIAPGFIETAMTKATAERIGSSIEAMRDGVASAVPVRRGGVPADVANAVAFLAAEESGYVTGQVLYVDGGAGLGLRRWPFRLFLPSAGAMRGPAAVTGRCRARL
jgi:3-oxoacyl-[acyl-carrier protein] reductase